MRILVLEIMMINVCVALCIIIDYAVAIRLFYPLCSGIFLEVECKTYKFFSILELISIIVNNKCTNFCDESTWI